jgi:hypothetical protein
MTQKDSQIKQIFRRKDYKGNLFSSGAPGAPEPPKFIFGQPIKANTPIEAVSNRRAPTEEKKTPSQIAFDVEEREREELIRNQRMEDNDILTMNKDDMYNELLKPYHYSRIEQYDPESQKNKLFYM